MSTLYRGSCHCGAIAFEVEGELADAVSCNCSICSRKGSLLWFVPRDKLRLLTPEDNLATYTFNRHVIKHRFCRTCGIHPFGEGTDAQGNRMAAINIRCLEGIELETVPIRHFNGRAL
ncbi:MAG TPA: GFA family protein [Gammaproteobacteria bacterium]|nr:GFA family protein [Gammaproteobacteria bacterium]